MKTREQILEAVEAGKKSGCFDGRDYCRLAEFFPVKDWATLGVAPGSDYDPDTYKPLELTLENVLSRLTSDLDFAFDKALGQRGLSAGLMFNVIKMWLWVLDDDLQNWDEDKYTYYGLPLLAAVADKYKLPNPIAGDAGNEEKYSDAYWGDEP